MYLLLIRFVLDRARDIIDIFLCDVNLYWPMEETLYSARVCCCRVELSYNWLSIILYHWTSLSLTGVLSVPLRLSAPSPPSSMFDVSGESEIITPGCHTNHTNVSRSVTQTLVLAVTALQWEGRVRISGQIRTQECFTWPKDCRDESDFDRHYFDLYDVNDS